MTNGLKMGQWSDEDASRRKLAYEITYVAKYCGSASTSPSPSSSHAFGTWGGDDTAVQRYVSGLVRLGTPAAVVL